MCASPVSYVWDSVCVYVGHQAHQIIFFFFKCESNYVTTMTQNSLPDDTAIIVHSLQSVETPTDGPMMECYAHGTEGTHSRQARPSESRRVSRLFLVPQHVTSKPSLGKTGRLLEGRVGYRAVTSGGLPGSSTHL